MIASISSPANAQWTQWGGPHRDFTTDSTGLAEQWPDDGPRELWSREIGGGHSSIVVDDGVLYTMCRRGDQDAVLAIDAATGKTLWETRYDAPTKPGMQLEFGPGPHSTPLVVGGRVFTVGAMVQFHCLDKKTGEILWSHDLMEEMGASHLQRGYGSSPIAYNDTVILCIGPPRRKPGVGITAFKQQTGEIAWKTEGFGGGYASPILVKFNGEDHLIVALGADRAGINPATGEVRWRLQVDFQSYGIMSSPLWIEPDKLFCSAGYGGGSRLIQLRYENGEYHAAELWHYPMMRVEHGVMARVGDLIYGCHDGSFAPAFLKAIDLKTGKRVGRPLRGFTKANVLGADGKLLILDETGFLTLAAPTPDQRKIIRVLAKAKVLEEKSWTAPTLVGTTLYVRDYHTIKALDLGTADKSK